MASVTDYGGPGDPLSAPALGGATGWAAAVAAALDNDDTTVNTRIAAIEASPSAGLADVASFAGADDDAKLAAAATYAAAQTYKPSLFFRGGVWTFSDPAPAPFRGMKLLGDGGGASVEQPRSLHPYATLLDINYSAGSWLTFSSRTDGFAVKDLAIQGPGDVAGSTFMGVTGSGQAATGVMENLGFDNWRHVLGTPGTPMLFTAYNMDGYWNINNCHDTAISIGGSDNNLWLSGLLLDCPYDGKAEPLMYLVYLDLTKIGPVYMTASGAVGTASSSGGLVISSGQQRTLELSGVRLGGRSVADEHQGAVVKISGDCTTFINGAWISQCDPAADGDSAVIQVSGGAKVVITDSTYKPHTGASTGIVWAQVDGATSSLTVKNCVTNVTGYPLNVKSINGGVLNYDESVVNVGGEDLTGQPWMMWTGTSAQYAALGSYEANRLYVTTD